MLSSNLCLQISTTLHKKGDYFDLTGESGRVWGVVSIYTIEYTTPEYSESNISMPQSHVLVNTSGIVCL